MILYHGTSYLKARRIIEHGFNIHAKPTWKVRGKKGFIYLSLAYAPFYSFARNKTDRGAIIKVEVAEDRLYPEDDFLMLAVKNKAVYTQKDLDSINIEKYKHLAVNSLQYLGNACTKAEDIKIIGMRDFDITELIIACDPSISPINYKIMGDYYKGLTEALYTTGDWKNYAIDYNKRRFNMSTEVIL